jgi:hypothetical protein
MRLSSVNTILVALSTLALAAPTSQLGSPKNFYLVTCTEGPGKNENYDAVAYYTEPPDSLSEDPEEILQISRPRETWEGVERKAEFDEYGTFVSKIDKNAATLETGEIAGLGKFEDEDFVCFKASGVLTSEEPDTCNVLYWCPSINVGESWDESE